jgi:sarcosine oxidase
MLYDTVVVGLGAMGSATLYHLARRGQRVIGIDRFVPPHDQGSSHGATRIIREAYFEHPMYVPLVRRAYELWDMLASEAGEPALLHRNGGLYIGSPGSTVVRGALDSALRHNVAHELLDADQMLDRFPAFVMRHTWLAVYEPGAGFLRPEAAIAAHLRLATGHGATVLCGTPVDRWQPTQQGVQVETTRGEFVARQAVFTVGAWAPGLITDAAGFLSIERQTSHWFAPRTGSALGPDSMPVAIWELEDERFFYTTPDVGKGVKASFHYGGETTDVDHVRRTASGTETDEIRGMLEQLVPRAAGAHRGATVCLYTDTPDKHFVIDRHPSHPSVIIISACSGHGFKFSAAIGEIAADLVEGQRPRVDIAPFAFSRFA